MPEASIIIRFTNRSEARLKNLITVARQASWNPNLEIIIVAMEKEANLNPLKFDGQPGRAKLVKHFTEQPFSSSKANNIGASLAQSDILIFQDADILFSPDAYKRIIKKIKEDGYEAVRVGEWCQNLSHRNTKKLVNAHFNSGPIGMGAVGKALRAANETKSCRRDAPGACHAIRKDVFVQNGGYSELFEVYGWEDCYFRFKMKQLRQANLEMPMLHLHHEINYQMAHQPDNNHLYSQLTSANPKEYESLLKRDRKDLLEKYPSLRPQE